MDLDLDHIEEVVDLYFVLKLCTSLQVLEITMPVRDISYLIIEILIYPNVSLLLMKL